MWISGYCRTAEVIHILLQDPKQISWCLEGQGINKNKVETVFWDTLMSQNIIDVFGPGLCFYINITAYYQLY